MSSVDCCAKALKDEIVELGVWFIQCTRRLLIVNVSAREVCIFLVGDNSLVVGLRGSSHCALGLVPMLKGRSPTVGPKIAKMSENVYRVLILLIVNL